jgi:hypothetical protein
MKAWAMIVRVIALTGLCCLVGTARADVPSAQVSPGSLVFGVVPVGQSLSQTVTFTVTSDAPVSITTITISGTNASEFTETDGCFGENNAPLPFPPGQGCSVTVKFTPTATGAQTASLSFQTSSVNPPSVPLSGGIPAISLFNSLSINQSLQGTPVFPGASVGTNSVALSCPASPVLATLSSTSDGTGFVFQDNYIRVTPTGAESGTNVCAGGTNDGGYNSCFQRAYESVATGFVGDNPDTTTVGNASFTSTYGVAPLDISSLLTPGTTQTVKFELMDVGFPPNQVGAFLGAASLKLVTNCTQTGVVPGGTIISNPINPGDANSLKPQFTYDGTTGQHIFYDLDYSTGTGGHPADHGVTIQPNTVARVKDIGIQQSAFANMVTGTSAGPAICMRLDGELDTDGTKLCKAFQIQCTNQNDPTAKGVNCAQSTLRNLLYETRFDSLLDFPPGSNPIFPGTGPGFLMGPDVWTSAPCNFTEGPEAGQLCPQSTLTEFFGAADPTSGGTSRGVNSTFVPVLNMPLPITVPVVTSHGLLTTWQNTGTVTLKFISSPAIYPLFGNPNPAHGFTPAPIQSVTFGTTRANMPVPDPTFPVPGDTTLFNTGTCPTATPGIITTPSSSFVLTEGRYLLHFFATDCANTEELNFQASNNPSVNWAKFKTWPVNIDMTKPVPLIASITVTPPAKKSQPAKVTVQFSCSDPNLVDGSDGSGVFFCGPYLFILGAEQTPTLQYTFSAPGHGTQTFSLTATDVAGNSATITQSYTAP